MYDHILAAMADYQVVLEPDENTPEWWAGAPSACRDEATGTFYLAARMREGRSPRGKRGYEVRLLRSDDGVHYTPINHLLREEGGFPVFERPALVQDPKTGGYRLYICSGLEAGWTILKLEDVEDPADFDVRTAKPVLAPAQYDDPFAHVIGYKDPVVYWDGAAWRLFVIGTDRVERIWHFLSADGVAWSPAQDAPFMANDGWHNFFTRPASVLPLGVGYLFVYEGSHTNWRDPVYNIATGLAYTPDLNQIIDLTPDAPLLRSNTPGDYATFRYSHWMAVKDQVYVYYEAARPNNTNELRLGMFSLNGSRG
jgi:hypothetical protein